MLSYLANFEEYFGPLRLLRYLTVRTALATLTALIIGFIIGPMLIRKFRQLKFGQHYDDDRTAISRSASTRRTPPRWAG